jgi:hypothetical protein
MDLDFTTQFGRPNGSLCKCGFPQYKMRGSNGLICSNYHRDYFREMITGTGKVVEYVTTKFSNLVRKMSVKLKIAGKTFIPVKYESTGEKPISIHRVFFDKDLWIITTNRTTFGSFDDCRDTVYWTKHGWSSRESHQWEGYELHAAVEDAVLFIDTIYSNEHAWYDDQCMFKSRFVKPMLMKEYVK